MILPNRQEDGTEFVWDRTYKSLLTLLEALGQSAAQSALRQSLSEEEDMANWIDQHPASMTMRFLELSASGSVALTPWARFDLLSNAVMRASRTAC